MDDESGGLVVYTAKPPGEKSHAIPFVVIMVPLLTIQFNLQSFYK